MNPVTGGVTNMEVRHKTSQGCTPNGSVKVAHPFNFFPRWGVTNVWGRDESMGRDRGRDEDGGAR